MTSTVLEITTANLLEHASVELTTVSPVFIGESHFKPSHYIDEQQLLKIIDQENLYEDWIQFFTKHKSYSNDPAYYEKFLMSHPKLKQGFRAKDSITGFVKSNNSLYIPGSTLKGALRTAIFSEVIRRSSHKLGKNTEDKEYIDTIHNKQSMTELMVRNLMRCIRVSDSHPFVDPVSFKSVVKYKSIIPSRKIMGLKIYNHRELEFLKSGVTTHFTVALDKLSVSSINPLYRDIVSSIESLIAILNKHYSSILSDFNDSISHTSLNLKYKSEAERQEARMEYVRIKFPKGLRDTNRISDHVKKLEAEFDQINPKLPDHLAKNIEEVKVFDQSIHLTPNMNIGGLGGFTTKVVLKAEAGNHIKEYEKQKKQYLEDRYKNHHHSNSPIAPRYLKVVDGYTLGWCYVHLKQN